MLPAASNVGLAIKTAQPAVLQSAERTSNPPAPETSRASAGEAAASNAPLETARAVTAPEQSAVAPRLREQENAERSERLKPSKDEPTGPPPAFEESPLERQARVAFDPPDPAEEQNRQSTPVTAAGDKAAEPGIGDADDTVQAEAANDPPPTPSERAEASFAETRTLATPREPASVNLEI